MSYILDALRKIEEKDPQGDGGRTRLGREPPQGPPSRGKKVYLVAAGLTVGALAVLAVLSVGGDPADEPSFPPSPAPAGERPVTVRLPAGEESDADGPVADVSSTPSGTFRPAAVAKKNAAKTNEKPAEEIAFEEVFGDLGLTDPPVPPNGSAFAEGWNFSELREEDRPERAGSGEKDGKSVPEPGRLYSIEDLPADVRKDLGDVTVTGHIYSDDVAFRLLMIGDEVLRVGERVAPGLVLEEITGTGAHVTFRGYRVFLAAF